jgi:hypothetical protein
MWRGISVLTQQAHGDVCPAAARNDVSGLKAKRKKQRPVPNDGGLVELSLQVARIAQTQASQAEVIRILADRLNAIEEASEQGDSAPTHYLNGDPINP